MNLTYTISNAAFKIVLYVFANLKVSGKHRIPKSGPVIVASNHLSILDPGIIALAFPRRVRWLAKNSLFRNFLVGGFLSAYGARAVSRRGPDSGAIRWSIEKLENNVAYYLNNNLMKVEQSSFYSQNRYTITYEEVNI